MIVTRRQEKLGIGLIGVGSIGKVHLRALLALPDVEIRWLCGRDQARVRNVAREFGIASVACYDDYRNALAGEESVHAVVIATPQMSHLEIGQAVLERGLPCFMEKPMTQSVEDSRTLCSIAAAAKVPHMAGFRLRYFDTVRMVRRTQASPLTVAVRMYDYPWVGGFWKYAPNQGGGNVMDQFCHCADLVRFLSGKNPVSVVAQTAALCGSGCPVDHIDASFKLEDGALASITMGDSGISSLLGKFSIEATYGTGTASVYERFGKAKVTVQGIPYRMEASEDKAAVEQMQAFVQMARGRETPGRPTFEDGCWADWMLSRALDAAREGREQSFEKEAE